MTYYDEIADGYDELHGAEQEKKLRIIKNEIQVSKSDKLLDVGCGSGISSDWDCRVTGIDPSEKLVKIAKTRGINAIVGNAENLPFRDETFDYVVSLTAVQNFSDLKTGIKEIFRVSKGYVVITCLKKSPKIEEIKEIIDDLFLIEKEIVEDKDIIYICKKKKNILK